MEAPCGSVKLKRKGEGATDEYGYKKGRIHRESEKIRRYDLSLEESD